MNRAVVIGGGLAGLSAAVRLAAAGTGVTLLEQGAQLGGKLRRVKLGEYSFDRGPSTITMKHAFEAVFASAGRYMEDYVSMRKLEQGTRNVFADGAAVDLSSDVDAVQEQIARYSPEDAASYRAFLAESARLYRLSERHFMNRLLPGWRDKLDPRLGAALLRVKPLTSLQSLLRRYFRHPHTLALFGRYATYVGSDPRRAPAVFAMLPHLETALGIYAVQGGTYAIVEALHRLALELGVEVRLKTRATRIASNGGRVSGVETEDGWLPADWVISGGDALTVNRDLVEPRDRPGMRDEVIEAYEPSLSGFVLMAGIPRKYGELLHHTVFYPADYGEEFQDIFVRGRAPSDPAIYICHSGYSEPGMAPEGGSNLFVLANAPYLSDRWCWYEEQESYGQRIMDLLERRCGLAGIRQAEELGVYTPEMLERDTSAYRGAIYGISSNTARQTFARPSNRGAIKGLWFAGGTTHPGGGTPMVVTSGLLTAEAALRERR